VDGILGWFAHRDAAELVIIPTGAGALFRRRLVSRSAGAFARAPARYPGL